MWTLENCSQYERKGLRYPSDLTDAEWALVEPHTGRLGSEVANAIHYLLWTGCQCALPKDFPPPTTAFEYLNLWGWDVTLARVHHELFVALREREGHGASPAAAIIESAKGAADRPVGL